MAYLILYILGIVLFHQLLRYSQRTGRSMVVVGAVNYIVAALFKLVTFGVPYLQGNVTLEWQAVVGGIVNGLIFIGHYFIIILSYQVAGVGITAALTGVGILVPVLVSWLAWAEPMPLFRWIAVLLLPAALLLMRPFKTGDIRLTAKANILLFFCFFLAGVVYTIHKAMNMYTQPSSSQTYQCFLFVTTALAATGVMLVKRPRITQGALVLGSIIGTANALVIVFLMVCLARMPAVVFYPTTGALTIVVNAVLARYLWREKPTRLQLAGMALAILIVLLTNI